FFLLCLLCFTLFPYTTLFRSLLKYNNLSKLLATRDLGLFGYCCFIFSLFVLIFLFIVVSSAFLKLITFALEFVKFTFCLLVFSRSEEHTSELQSRFDLVCRLL